MIPFAPLVAWWRHFRRDRAALLIAQVHEEHLRAEAERYAPDRRLDLYGKPWGGPWPADLCAYPPCDREDGYLCTSHTPPAGKHHRRQSEGERVVIASVTDLSEKRGRAR